MDLDIKNQRSIAGLRANAVAFLTNLSTFVGVGLIFSLIVLILEPENEFVRKYSKQTLSLNVIIIVALPLNIIMKIGSAGYDTFKARFDGKIERGKRYRSA